jgi:hypothetical protein
MFSQSNADSTGLFQRLNIINSNETRTVPKLKQPVHKMSELGIKLYKKLLPLEHMTYVVRDTPEATKVFEEWFEQFKVDTKNDPADVRGRLNVLVQRNKNMLAWALDDYEHVPPVKPINSDNPDATAPDIGELPTTRVIEVDQDIMLRAIELSEYQLRVRRVSQPIVGISPWVECENHITTVLKNHGGAMTRTDLSKRIHGERYGTKIFSSALANLASEQMIVIQQTPSGRRPKETIKWIGESA